MDKPETDTKSEIARIFREYRASLNEIVKKLDESYPQPADEEPSHSTENESSTNYF